jgi:enoyl-CoA hydratase/carnithine racemase
MTGHDESGRLVLRQDDGHIAEIVLHRPHALNALSTALMRELITTCEEVAADVDVRAVVLSGAGSRAFCVGADLKERKGFSTDDLFSQRPVFRAAFDAVRALPVPVIAAVHGFALGGGLELALSCDLIVVDDTALVGLPEVTIGLVPGGGGTQLLARRTGLATALDLILSGRHVGAEEAVRLGVVDRRVAEGQARDEAMALAGVCAAASPTAVRAAKRAVREGFDLPLTEGLDLEGLAWQEAVSSPDRVEGITAFNERRPPVWPRRSP